MKSLKKLWENPKAQYLIKNYISLNNGALQYNDRLVKALRGIWLDRIWAERYDMGITGYLKARKDIKDVLGFLENLKGREL